MIVRAHDYEEALRLPSEHEYGNGVAVFTRDGDTLLVDLPTRAAVAPQSRSAAKRIASR